MIAKARKQAGWKSLWSIPFLGLVRVLKIYSGIKPLLASLAAFRFIPSAWRKSIVLFTRALEALSLSAPEVTAAFKAGRVR